MNTLIAVAIAPCGTGDELSAEVAEVVRIIRASGLPNRTNSMFTEIEGEWDEVMAVVPDRTRLDSKAQSLGMCGMLVVQENNQMSTIYKLPIGMIASFEQDRRPRFPQVVLGIVGVQQQFGCGLAPGGPQGIGVGLTASFCDGLGEIGEQHREPQPGRDVT